MIWTIICWGLWVTVYRKYSWNSGPWRCLLPGKIWKTFQILPWIIFGRYLFVFWRQAVFLPRCLMFPVGLFGIWHTGCLCCYSVCLSFSICIISVRITGLAGTSLSITDIPVMYLISSRKGIRLRWISLKRLYTFTVIRCRWWQLSWLTWSVRMMFMPCVMSCVPWWELWE